MKVLLQQDKGSKAITVQQLEKQLNELGKLYSQVNGQASRQVFQKLTQRGLKRIFHGHADRSV